MRLVLQVEDEAHHTLVVEQIIELEPGEDSRVANRLAVRAALRAVAQQLAVQLPDFFNPHGGTRR